MVGFLVLGLGNEWLGFWFQVKEMEGQVSGSRFRKEMFGFLVPGVGDGWLAFWFQD